MGGEGSLERDIPVAAELLLGTAVLEFIRPFAFAWRMGVAFAKVDLSVTGKTRTFILEATLRAFVFIAWAFIVKTAFRTFVVKTAFRAFVCITRAFIVKTAFRTLVVIARAFIIETTLRAFITRCAFGLFFTDGWFRFFDDSRPFFGKNLMFNVFCVFNLLGSDGLFLRSRLFITHVGGVFRIGRAVEITGPLTDGGFVFAEVLLLRPWIVFAAAAAITTVTTAATLVAVIAVSTVAAAAASASFSIIIAPAFASFTAFAIAAIEDSLKFRTM